MKRFMSAILMLGLTTPVWADIQAENKRVDELDLEQEVESIEQFGSDATAEETRKETDRLSKETKALEKQIANMKVANERAQLKTKNLQALYQKKAALAVEVQRQAANTEVQKNKSEKEVARLQGKVKAKEQVVISSVNKRKTAEKRIAELNKQKNILQKRLVVAEANIKRNDLRRKALRAKAIKLSQANYKLNKKVVRAENKARSTAVR